MIKDAFDQEIKPGQNIVWTSYNELWYGVVKKVTESRVSAKYGGSAPHLQNHTFYPNPAKAIVIDEHTDKRLLMQVLKG
jgi:hypothetical protein